MATALRFRRGTTAQHATFTGKLAEVTYDTTLKTLRVHDGSTPGGFPLAAAGTSIASLIGYDNDNSGLSAGNVQAAIDELAANAVGEKVPMDALSLGVISDGVTLDTGQIQAAINAAAAAKRPIYFPEKVYKMGSSRVRIPSFSHVICHPNAKFERSANTAQGTFEVYGAQYVILENLWVHYTNSAYTLGYAQTGISTRSGSHHVYIKKCRVTGRINRQFHIINCSHIFVEECEMAGAGNAGLRIVSDNAANLIVAFSDEVTTWGPSRNIHITRCKQSGATTVDGTVTTGTSYGFNAAGLPGTTDLLENIFFTECVAQSNAGQGFEMGGKTQRSAMRGCIAYNIPGGVGFLIQGYDGVFAERVTVANCQAGFCFQGFFSYGIARSEFSGCRAYGCTYGLYDYNSYGTIYHGCVSENNSGGGLGYGILIGGTSSGFLVIGCRIDGNINGLTTQSSTYDGRVFCNRIYANSSSNLVLDGSGHTEAYNT